MRFSKSEMTSSSSSSSSVTNIGINLKDLPIQVKKKKNNTPLDKSTDEKGKESCTIFLESGYGHLYIIPDLSIDAHPGLRKAMDRWKNKMWGQADSRLTRWKDDPTNSKLDVKINLDEYADTEEEAKANEHCVDIVVAWYFDTCKKKKAWKRKNSDAKLPNDKVYSHFYNLEIVY